jgi:hypothetical protein
MVSVKRRIHFCVFACCFLVLLLVCFVHTFTNIHHVANQIDQGNGKEQARVLNAVQFTKAFYDKLVTLWHNVQYRIAGADGPLPRTVEIGRKESAATSTTTAKGTKLL